MQLLSLLRCCPTAFKEGFFCITRKFASETFSRISLLDTLFRSFRYTCSSEPHSRQPTYNDWTHMATNDSLSDFLGPSKNLIFCFFSTFLFLLASLFLSFVGICMCGVCHRADADYAFDTVLPASNEPRLDSYDSGGFFLARKKMGVVDGD